MVPIPSGSDWLRVFVYGTLKPGESNFGPYCAEKVVYQQEAIAHGQLFDLPLGYPAMVEGDGEVRGYVLWFSDRTVLHHLDKLEDYDPHRPLQENEYLRRQVPIFDLHHQPLGSAWTYLMSLERIKQLNGSPVLGGIWTGCRSIG
ncbi:MAG: gamma-glutamylcyclotransferase [Synechococcales bacterium]|nr:gamma-glutamylcyclotransferase [Synechococcales bacterium]